MKQTLILCLVVFSWGCQDFLSVEIDDQLSNEDILSDANNANLAAVGLYNHLGDNSLYGEFLIMYPELMAGHLQPSPDRSITTNLIDAYANTYQFMTQLDESRISDVYEVNYEGIMSASRLIEAVPEIEDSRSNLLRAIEGEARVIRAILYFQLLQIYGQDYNYTPSASHLAVPYYDQPLGVFERLPRASVGEVYNQIIEDLQTARPLLNGANVRAGNPKYWARPGIPEALLSRVYLFQGRWQLAIDAGAEARNLLSFDLLTPDSYVENWTESRYAEALWILDQSYRQATGINSAFGSGDSTRSQTFVVTQELFDSYPQDDERRQLYEVSESLIFSKKYPFEPNTTQAKPIIRASEVILNQAEAHAQLGQLTEAENLMREVLLQSQSDPALPSGNASEWLTFIAEERAKELALEGMAFWDIRRRQENVVREACESSGFENCSQTYPSDRYVLPIPQEAIIVNPLLEQNPGY